VAIQKKSLISNRTATKKALIAKPERSNKPDVITATPTRVKTPDAFRVKTPDAFRVKTPDAFRVKTPDAFRVKTPDAFRVRKG
jgi:hypothetical protein